MPTPLDSKKSKTNEIPCEIITLHDSADRKNRRSYPSPIGMKINDHDLRQLNEERLQTLQEKDPAALLQLTNRLLDDLKEARERLNQDPSNSSRPSGSQDPWFRAGDEESTEEIEEDEDGGSDREPEESGSASSEKEESDGNESPKEKTGKGRASKPKNKPGKQPGAQGFGRAKEPIVNETIYCSPSRHKCITRIMCRSRQFENRRCSRGRKK